MGAVATSCGRLFYSGMVLGKKVFCLLSGGMECRRRCRECAGWFSWGSRWSTGRQSDRNLPQIFSASRFCNVLPNALVLMLRQLF